jgi:membrane protein
LTVFIFLFWGYLFGRCSRSIFPEFSKGRSVEKRLQFPGALPSVCFRFFFSCFQFCRICRIMTSCSFIFFEVLMHNVFPSNMEGDVRGYIETNIIPNMKGISNLTIVLALVFATNGTFSLINGFNENSDEKLTDVKEFILSFFITIGFITIVFLALFGVYYVEVVMKLFTPAYDISWLVKNLSKIIGFVSFPLFYFILLTLFYWLGTVKIARFRQAIPGAILTTVLFVLTTFIFAIYVKDIARYNVLYGSIGSMILLMVWVNVNVYLLLFGNELNMALRKLRIEKLLSDEIKKEAIHYHSPVTEPNLESDEEHRRKMEERQKN